MGTAGTPGSGAALPGGGGDADTVGSPGGPNDSPSWSTPPVHAHASVATTERVNTVVTAMSRESRNWRSWPCLTIAQYST